MTVSLSKKTFALPPQQNPFESEALTPEDLSIPEFEKPRASLCARITKKLANLFYADTYSGRSEKMVKMARDSQLFEDFRREEVIKKLDSQGRSYLDVLFPPSDFCTSLTSQSDCVYAQDSIFTNALRRPGAQVSWMKNSTLPKALFVLGTQETDPAYASSNLLNIHYISQAYDVQIRHASNPKTLYTILEKAMRKGPPSLVYFFGHGHGNSMRFGHFFQLSADSISSISPLKDLPNNATAIFFSCSTGVGKAYADNLANLAASVAPHIRIYAPTIPINTMMIKTLVPFTAEFYDKKPAIMQLLLTVIDTDLLLKEFAQRDFTAFVELHEKFNTTSIIKTVQSSLTALSPEQISKLASCKDSLVFQDYKALMASCKQSFLPIVELLEKEMLIWPGDEHVQKFSTCTLEYANKTEHVANDLLNPQVIETLPLSEHFTYVIDPASPPPLLTQVAGTATKITTTVFGYFALFAADASVDFVINKCMSKPTIWRGALRFVAKAIVLGTISSATGACLFNYALMNIAKEVGKAVYNRRLLKAPSTK